MADVTHFHPRDLLSGKIRNGSFDWYLFIDDGTEFCVPRDLQPQAWWAIDTHSAAERLIRSTQHSELIFTAQRDGAVRIGRPDDEQAPWLPLACDSSIHVPVASEKTYDVCFVGRFLGSERCELLELLRRHASLEIGQCHGEEMAKAYGRARISFNRSVFNDINMRVFEALSCGSLLLTNDLQDNGQAELFRDGVHFATYRDAEELLDKLSFYLKHADIRDRVASAGREEVQARHTYRHRMQTVLAAIQQRRPLAIAAGSTIPLSLERDSTMFSSADSDLNYHDAAPREIIALVPPTARRILDIGCGSGRIGELLKERQECFVWGIEPNAVAAQLARTRLDHVWNQDLENGDWEIEPGSLDSVICGDALERLHEPEALLRKVSHALAPDGLLIACLPNACHHSFVHSLLMGNWTYQAVGVMNRTHLRIYTRREVEKLLFRAGFMIESLRPRMLANDLEAISQFPNDKDELEMGSLTLRGLSREQIEEICTYQYLITARKSAKKPKSTTIVIWPEDGEDWRLRTCLDHLQLRTHEPHEIRIVRPSGDKASENPSWRDTIADVLAETTSEYIVFMRSRCVVSTGWLTRLQQIAEQHDQVALVSPVTMRQVEVQMREIGKPYQGLSDFDGFAWDFARSQERRNSDEASPLKATATVMDTEHLEELCVLTPRSVLQELLDLESVDTQAPWSMTLVRRLCHQIHAQQGRVVLAMNCLVHELPKLPPQDDALVAAREESMARPSTGGAATKRVPSPASIDSSKDSEPRLSLCMIARNNSAILEECLMSIRPWVDEMVVVDTGSDDNTPTIAERLGARVFHFPWCDSFSAARNESLRHARGEWLFWMDTDDVIDPEQGKRLRELALTTNHAAQVMGYVAQVHCPGPLHEWEPDVTVVDHVKLLRNHPEIRFERRIHEQVLASIRRLSGEVVWSDLFVRHKHGSCSWEDRQRKHQRDLTLLLLELDDQPDDPFTHFNLGMTYADMGHHEQAIDSLCRSIMLAGPEESQVRKAYALVASSWCALARYDAALRALDKGLSIYPDDPELHFRRGIALQYLHRPEEAIVAYRSTLSQREGRHFSSLDRGITGFKCRHNLALALRAQNRFEEAICEWQRAVEEEPRFRAAWRALVDLALRQGHVDRAKEWLAQMERITGCEAEVQCARMDILRYQGHTELARKKLIAAYDEFPDDLAILQRYAHQTFELGQLQQAESALVRLSDFLPEDSSIYHNLAFISYQLRRLAPAEKAARRALELDPSRKDTRALLDELLASGTHYAS